MLKQLVHFICYSIITLQGSYSTLRKLFVLFVALAQNGKHFALRKGNNYYELKTLKHMITGFVTRLTRRVPLVEQELLTLPLHLSSPPVFSGVRVTRSLVLYVCFVDRCLSFFTFFHLVIVLSVLLRYTDSDYPFSIFKLFLESNLKCAKGLLYGRIYWWT